MADYNLIGLGVYSVPETARIAHISSGRIRRWLRGYTRDHGTRTSPPVFTSRLPIFDGHLALSFLDLIEVRFVDAFRREGVSWGTLRIAHAKARVRVGSDHPFATGRFKTDGRTILHDVAEEEEDGELLDIVHDQHGFKRLIAPFFRGLQFEDDSVARWFPDVARRVVLDPRRSFGQPIVAEAGISTRTLAAAVQTEGSVAKVARWFGINPKDVHAAVRYEQHLAA